ncbi:hypothetical protein M3P36_12540 [Altererythrobacter sp. KTW20L]|uniref:hypothetical protein n=1 Tax=Altererythrobacter sp. KTW20L TaxID=2942210 RepID=UPI0020C0990B|nr:hypothetical protein [Altererythrobacter sp. KTW20L]MCL6251866.1 hypothetical protein [Altererythrobacter sp. KTW20L]
MKLTGWTAPGGSEELALAFGDGGTQRLLVLPAWFDEGNKLRHVTIETMRALERLGVASMLPDLPGCNESLAPLDKQDLPSWRAAAVEAARQLGCTHVLAVRAATNIAPDLPGWAWVPLAGKSALRAMLRAQIIASKEAGNAETSDGLCERSKAGGLVLAGYRLGAEMVAGLAEAELPHSALTSVTQAEIGGPGLWLRAEPEHDQAQAEALARIIAAGLLA